MADVNLFGEEWDDGRERPGWQWRRLRVGRRLGAERIGASLYELAPGQRTFPYHWQAVEEEWLIVLRGRPTLRDPSGERTLEPGDCVVFKRGPEGAHTVRNDTDEPARLLILSSDSPVEIAFYPRTAARSASSARTSTSSSARTRRSTTSRARSKG